MEVKIKDLLDIYDQEVRKNVRNKTKLLRFEKNKMMFINKIHEILISGNYDGGRYNIFLIRDPKYRIVMSQGIIDKVINHYVTRFILIPKLEKRLDIRNVATRKNLGTSYAYKLLNKYLEKYKKYDYFYILKLDIKKYFYRIDHNILKNLIKP